MKVIITTFLSLLFLIFSCGGEKSKTMEKPALEDLLKAAKAMEDSLDRLQNSGGSVTSLHRNELINRYLPIYRFYPESEEAPKALDKVQMVFSGIGAYESSIAYGDTLLELYPNYPNRLMVLESQGATYDIFIQPRDSAKVRFYYETLLKENPNLESEKRKGIKARLKNNHLSFDEFVDQQMQDQLRVEVVK